MSCLFLRFVSKHLVCFASHGQFLFLMGATITFSQTQTSPLRSALAIGWKQVLYAYYTVIQPNGIHWTSSPRSCLQSACISIPVYSFFSPFLFFILIFSHLDSFSLPLLYLRLLLLDPSDLIFSRVYIHTYIYTNLFSHTPVC